MEMLIIFWSIVLGLLAWPITAQTDSVSPLTSTLPPTSATSNHVTAEATVTSTGNSSRTRTPSSASLPTGSTPPDVLLNVPTLSVGKIELDVDDLQANINLNAQIAGLVSLNAGVAVSIQKVNITIADVDASLELIVRLGHLVDIVNRTFASLDLNPLLISALNDVTSLVDDVVGEVDGLLGSITQGGSTVSFLIDNLGNIVSQAVGTAGNTVSSIVGDYTQNMTYTGDSKQLSNGLIQKTFSYGPLNALVNIVFNTAGQVVQAVVAKSNNGSGSASTTNRVSSSTVVSTPKASTAGQATSTA